MPIYHKHYGAFARLPRMHGGSAAFALAFRHASSPEKHASSAGACFSGDDALCPRTPIAPEGIRGPACPSPSPNETHFYVGQSARTNEEGIRQFCEILEGWGLEGSEVKLEKVLHLKTGVNYLEDGNMLVSGEFVTKPDFEQYNRIEIPEDEAYAANCIWVNGTVIVPEGYPTVLKAVQDAGYETITVDTSEYRKLDGGLSCLSLRF